MSDTWNITIEACGPRSEVESWEDFYDGLDDMLDVLEPYDPVLIVPAPESVDGTCRYGAELTVAASSPWEASDIALRTFAEAIEKVRLPLWPLVRFEVKSDDELTAELERETFPELLGVAELADRLSVSKSRASELARSTSFPQPVVVLAAGPVWLATSVEKYCEGWVRKPGRPSLTIG